MFGVRDGFDITIGNPPYFVLPANYPNLKYFEEQYASSRGGKKNLYKLFFECALKLIHDDGVLVFITPSNYLTSSDSIELRRLLINKSRIVEIIEYSESDKVFEAVTQAVCTIVLVKSKLNNLDISYIKNGKRYLINQKGIISDPNLFIKNLCPVILKMKKQTHVLNEYIIGYQGEVNVSTKKNLFTKNNRTDVLPLVRGNQIRRHSVVNFPDEYCPLNAQGRDHCHIKRIVFQEIANAGLARRLNAVLLKDVICGHTTNYIFPSNSKVDIKFVLALINSSLFNYYFKFYNQTNHVPIGEIKQIPVPDLSNICQDRYVEIIDRLSKSVPKQTQEYEHRIDNMVYELYGLTKKEIEIVENLGER